ncbi:AAR2 protein [Cardiosporidium cionae]|uniref:AAR2 protein n=1 Tax=Cardiosporidium cionae TaxID=476202 RepID=A0ABQ7J979_9APIC|nr:AAR2 protein [Cardiosporidium cionae]|eukprot:KAF8820518.1 AAR2 protein [Cardiosporidium cionae]
MSRHQQPSFCMMLFLNSPSDLQIGVDYCVWKTSPKFAGITELSPGIHYLYWSSKASTPLVPTSQSKIRNDSINGTIIPSNNRENSHSTSAASDTLFPKRFLSQQLDSDCMSDTRCGCFVYLRRGEVLTRRWSAEEAAFVPLSGDEHRCYSAGVLHGDFFGNMAPFPKEFIVPWRKISNFIAPSLLDQLEPVKKFIYQDSNEKKEAIPKEKSRRLRVKRNTETSLEHSLPNTTTDEENNVMKKMDLDHDGNAMEGEETFQSLEKKEHAVPIQENNDSLAMNMAAPSLPYGVALFYSSIPKVSIPANATSAEVTRLSMDKSSILDRLIEQSYNGNELSVLGELQFAYIAFLLGYNFASFEQWKCLLILLCNSESAVKRRPALFHGLLLVMYTQIEQAPDDLVSDEFSKENFLIHCIVNLIEICSDDPTSTGDFKAALEDFGKLVKNKFNMEPFELLAKSDDAPQIC